MHILPKGTAVLYVGAKKDFMGKTGVIVSPANNESSMAVVQVRLDERVCGYDSVVSLWQKSLIEARYPESEVG